VNRAAVLAAFLAGYRGLPRDVYGLDLRQFIGWCEGHHLRLFDARRARARVSLDRHATYVVAAVLAGAAR